MGSDVLVSMHSVEQLWVYTSSVMKLYATEWLYKHDGAWNSIRRMGSGFGEFWESILASVCMVWSDDRCIVEVSEALLENPTLPLHSFC